MRRLLYFILALVMSTGMANATYKATLKLEVGSVKGGNVLAATSQQSNPTINSTSDSATGSGGSGISTNDTGTLTFYAYAKANDGYEFVGWCTNSNGTGTIIEGNPAQLSLNAEHVRLGIGNGTTYTYYAIFRPILYYATITAVADAQKGYAAAYFDESEVTGSTATTSVHGTTFTGYVWAEPIDETYTFTGWSETAGGDIVSTDNPYEVTFESTSTNEAAPTEKTLYANFEAPNFMAKAQSAGNGFAYVSLNGRQYSTTAKTTLANDDATTTFYFKSDANTGYMIEYWEDSNGNRYEESNPQVQLINAEAIAMGEFTMTAHYTEAPEPEPEPEPESEWTQYITNTDPVPFTIEFGATTVTITPNDLTAPYYIICATESNNTAMWGNPRMPGFVADGGYTQASNEATWEWKLREWADPEDELVGKQVLSYDYFTLMKNIGTEEYTFIVAHCDGVGPDHYRTSRFVSQVYNYKEEFHFDFYISDGGYTDQTQYFIFAPMEEEADQPYVYVILNEKDRAGRTNMEVWEEAVAATDEANFTTGQVNLSSNEYSAGTYTIIAGAVEKKGGKYVLYGKMLEKTWKVDNTDTSAKVTSVEVTIYNDKQSITVVPNVEAKYTALLAKTDYYSSANEAQQDYIDGWVSGGFYDGTQTIPMGKLYGYEGEGEYYLIVFGSKEESTNDGGKFTKTQTTPYTTTITIQNLGDMSNDGIYTISDLATIIKQIVTSPNSRLKSDSKFPYKADMNCDGEINLEDFQEIANRILNQE